MRISLVRLIHRWQHQDGLRWAPTTATRVCNVRVTVGIRHQTVLLVATITPACMPTYRAVKFEHGALPVHTLNRKVAGTLTLVHEQQPHFAVRAVRALADLRE